jgi:hypothetical protein
VRLSAASLDLSVQTQLDLIEPSIVAPNALLLPCAAQLKNGVMLPCIYFIEPPSSERLLGYIAPEDESRWISADQVASVGPSSYRLPARFANEIYSRGEQGFGYFDFTLEFSRWSRRDYMFGGYVDFLDYPKGRGPADVQSVLFRNKKRRRSVPPRSWCVFCR